MEERFAWRKLKAPSKAARWARGGRRGGSAFLPLAGIRVIEFSQMVMGPTCGLILADLGADVIKVEPPKGDRTRIFKGPASGFFANYCRNKRSVARGHRRRRPGRRSPGA